MVRVSNLASARAGRWRCTQKRRNRESPAPFSLQRSKGTGCLGISDYFPSRGKTPHEWLEQLFEERLKKLQRKERIFPFQSRLRDAPEHRLAHGYYRVESKRHQGRARVGKITGARGDSVKMLVAPPGW